jgi:hypothetical protein
VTGEAQGISEQCPHGDPTCPCPDGDWCHYEDDPATGTKAMRCPTPGHCDAGISEQDRQQWQEGPAFAYCDHHWISRHQPDFPDPIYWVTHCSQCGRVSGDQLREELAPLLAERDAARAALADRDRELAELRAKIAAEIFDAVSDRLLIAGTDHLTRMICLGAIKGVVARDAASSGSAPTGQEG